MFSRFFWRGRRDLNYGSSFYRLKLCEIPYENQCVLFIAYNGVQSNAKPLGEKIGENSGTKYRGRNGLRPPCFCDYNRASCFKSSRNCAFSSSVICESSSSQRCSSFSFISAPFPACVPAPSECPRHIRLSRSSRAAE